METISSTLNEVYLPTLDIRFYSDWEFHNEGAVPDLRAHAEELAIKGLRVDNSKISPTVAGLCYHNPNSKQVFVFYKDSYGKFETLRIAAHEETHALHDMGRLDLLQEKLDQSDLEIHSSVRNLDMSQYRDSDAYNDYDSSSKELKAYLSHDLEEVAETGAIYALFDIGVELNHKGDIVGSHKAFSEASDRDWAIGDDIKDSALKVGIEL